MEYLVIVDEHVEGDFYMYDGDYVYDGDLDAEVIEHLVATAVLVPLEPWQPAAVEEPEPEAEITGEDEDED